MQIKMRKVLALLSVMAMLCTLLPLGVFTATVSAASNNLVVNGDFESGNTTGWSGGLSASADAAHDGSYGATATSTNAWGSLMKQTVSLNPNSAYYMSFWFKSNADAVTAASFELKYKGNSGSETKIKLINKNANSVSMKTTVTEWTQVEVYFVTGDDNYNTTNLLFYRGSGTAGDAASVCIDSVELYELDNMLVNGGFEDGLNGWTVMKGGQVTTAEYSAGSAALQGTATAKYNFFVSQAVTVEPNTDYTISFKTKLAASGGQSRFYISTDNTSNGKLNSTYYWTAATDSWTQCCVTVNSGENTTLYLSPAQGVNNGGDIYFDEIFMVGPYVESDEPEEPTYGDLINGDFEGEGGWTISGGVIETIDGDKALKGTTTGDNMRYSTVAEQIIAVTPNTDLVLSLNTKYVGANTGAMARVHVYKGATGTTEALDSSNTYYWNIGANTWEGKELKFNAGDEGIVRIVIQQHTAPNTSTAGDGNIYFDDFVVSEYSEDVEYVGSYPETMTSGADIRFMTYNVLVGQDTANGGYSWGSAITGRPEKACAMINYYKPDVIALEEFSGEWYDYFVANMPDYAFGEMTSADSQNNGKLYTCIAYNVNTIRLLDTDLFRNTVSRWGTQGMRYVNVGFCEVIATGEKFIAAATHPDAGDLVGTEDINGDGVAEEGAGYWRPQQLEEAAAYVAGLSETHKMPVIWGGDFNSGLQGTYDDNVSWYKVADAGFTDATNGRYIDHIFYNGMATHLYETTVADAAVSGASDHNAVFADIQFLDEYATPIKNAKDYIKTQGRNQLKDGALWLDFSASGIEFSANCEGKVALNLNVKSLKQTDSYGGLYFTVIVDGVKKDRAECHITSTGNVELVLAENLTPGNHTFEVYRQTEHRGAEVGISSIVMNGSFNEKPADNRLYIEFIGDSISTGFGALGTSSDSDGGSPKWQDATAAYPYLTAKALGADFSDVAYSGIGAKYGWQDPNMHTFYPYQRWQYDRNTQYNFNARQPDVIVIALGTNDIAMEGEKGITVEQRLAGYQELLDLVRAKNPNSKIVWIYGMMKDDDNARIPAIIEENGGAAEGLYSLELVTNTAGAGWHPSAAGQQKFADDLVAFLNSDVLVKYVGDVEDDAYDVIALNGTSRMEMTADKLGLAFRFQINANGIEVINETEAVLDNATIDAFDDGGSYKLLSMGAIVSNDPIYGLAGMTKEMADGRKVLDVNATYLCDLEADSAQYAVRITNIPLANEDTIIYARAYYTFEYEGRVITVYDDLQQANYIDKYDSNDGVLEW